MSSGKTHSKASLLAAIPVSVGIGIYTNDPLTGVVAGTGCASGIFLTPDLDQEGISASEWSIIKSTLGVGFIWLWFWWLYAKAFKHRSLWSHFPVVDTLIRIMYLTIPLFIAGLVLGWEVNQTKLWFFAWWVFGLAVSDTIHWVMDGLPIRR